MSIRKIAAAAAVVAGALTASVAQARPDVQWQVRVETPTIRLPGHVVLPLPPIPVPRAVVVTPQRDERYSRETRDTRRWDADGDGIPNRYDRVYNPRWDRDGDGIPNRYDAYPGDPRNGRGWHGNAGPRHEEYRRDGRWEDRSEWREDRRDWRDDRRH